jgi:hypothetical protein
MNAILTKRNIDFFSYSTSEYYLKNFSKTLQNWEILRLEEVKESTKGRKSQKD